MPRKRKRAKGRPASGRKPTPECASGPSNGAAESRRAGAEAGPADGDDAGEVLVVQWQGTRSGARAGRGFHFQDAVGAWLAAMVAEGTVGATSLVPEGFEDMSLEGPQPRQVQIKSRVRHLGPFPVAVACRHVLDAWERHAARVSDGSRLTVVFERGVESELNLRGLDQTLEESLSSDSALRSALQDAATRRGMRRPDLDHLLSTTAVVGTTWEEVTQATIAHLRTRLALPPSALTFVARQLRIEVAEASDANATADYENRRSLNRTELVAAIDTAAEHIDIDSLESALRDGLCEPLDLTQPAISDERFYEGTATQPAHVAAGLVVPRPLVMAEVLAGLQQRSAAVITGPSGVGKSAVLWTVPLALPGVLWFRVRRLLDEDAPPLIRLARAYGVAHDAPVGFLVDSAGTGDFDGWARLRAEAAAVPGVLLVATARSEDLMTLGDLSGSATITVRLDEAAAEAIFNGLSRRGATTAPHWAEAFAKSKGLTLEFTHMLTSGRRLQDVIDEQIRRRVDERRHRELEVLSLVSVADRWSATLSAAAVATACGATVFQLRESVTRLAEEHLMVERDGVMSGLHRIRSGAISDAVHAQPPPDIATTTRRVVGLVPAPQLHRFIANLLRDDPAAADVVIDAGSNEPLVQDRLAAYLHGLRLADFYEVAKTWKAVADQHEVPASSQPLLFQFAAAGLDFPDIFPSELRAARDAMELQGGPIRRVELVTRVGEAALAGLLASTGDVADATHLFAVLEGCGQVLADEVRAALNEQSPLVTALQNAAIDDLADCLAAARACDRSLADLLVDSIGGEEEMLRRLRIENPWVTELELHAEGDTAVGYCRFLHISDALQGDPREQAVAIGRLLLRCLPRIESVDVQGLLPGGHELRVGDYTHGSSGLQRRYDHSTLGVAWNQARLRAALTLLGDTDTMRLTEALPLLEEAADLAYEIATGLVAGKGPHVSLENLNDRVAQLHERGRSLRPPLGSVELGDTAIAQEAPVGMADDLSGIITDLTGNVFPRLSKPDSYRALATYISETVIGRHLDGTINEPWQLVGIEGPPASLDRLHTVLLDLHAVVNELANDSADLAKVGRSARSGGRAQALHRAAETCRREGRRRRQARRDALQRQCRSTGLRANVLRDHRDGPATDELAVTVELGSLLEWPDAVSRLQAVLSVERPLGETYLMIPLRNGRPVPSLAMKLITTVWPSPDLGEWASLLADPYPSPLTDTFEDAQMALQTVSGICHLPEEQQGDHAVQAAAEAAASQFVEAHEALLNMRSDPLIDELVSILETLATRVQAELSGTNTGPSVAEQIASGALQGGDTDEFVTIVGARYFALEWDIDPDAAVEMLPSQG